MNTSIVEILQKKWVLSTFVGSLSFAAGLGVGYYIFNPKPEEPEKPVEDNGQMSLFDYEPETIEEEYEEIEEPEITYENVNVFETVLSNWDYEIEIAQRGEGLPYVIHYDEFMANESNYQQETLTYYSADDILADQSDTPIYNYSKLMGDLRFGHGSNDQNVVYIRNDQLHMEWEILNHSGSFEEEVVGLEIEERYAAQDLKHSNNMKFRME